MTARASSRNIGATRSAGAGPARRDTSMSDDRFIDADGFKGPRPVTQRMVPTGDWSRPATFPLAWLETETGSDHAWSFGHGVSSTWGRVAELVGHGTLARCRGPTRSAH